MENYQQSLKFKCKSFYNFLNPKRKLNDQRWPLMISKVVVVNHFRHTAYTQQFVD